MNFDNIKVQQDPTNKDIKFILELFNLNKLIEAKDQINKLIIKFPHSSILFNIMGAVLAGQGNLNEATQNYKKSLEINPGYAQAHNNLGIAYQKLNKASYAIDSYEKAISLKNDFAEAYNNLGNVQHEIIKLREAQQNYEKAIKIKPDYAEAFNGLGTVYESLGNKEQAINNFQKAVKIKPDYAEVYNNLGIIFSELARFDESLLSYKKSVEFNPNNENAYNNLGNLLSSLGKFDEATVEFTRAIKIRPNFAKAYSNLLLNLNYKIDFNLDLYLSTAKNFRLNCKTITKNLSFKYQYNKKPKKLKLGFMSADFGNHPGGFFTLSTLRELRKKNFEIVAYSTKDRSDDLSSFFRSLFSKWNSIEKKNDEEVVEQIFKDGIHILIDLQGHSANNRLPIFMYKAAPIQATWHCQGSTGIPEINYMIGSTYLTPKNEEKHWIEKVLRLPEMAQCFTPPNFDVKINDLPAKKNKFITFGSLNKLTKINDDVINLWSKILQSIPNSKLILKTKNLDNKKITNDIIAKFKKQNVNKDCLILLGESKTRKELLQTYNKIDLALDPFPFQGYTTTCESVWMGVPVLTLKGNRYLFHAGESINANLNMFDWIAKDYEDYISKAINFSSNIDKLSKIRVNLREITLKSPVSDAKNFANHFSNMLWKMWKN